MASLKSSIVSLISSGIVGVSKFANDSVIPAATPLYDCVIALAAADLALANLSPILAKAPLSGSFDFSASACAFS
jgi:hypothetical protein